MAGGSTKEIRSRIRSMESTKQITKAMEMVAASKLRHAQAQVMDSRPYFQIIYGVIQDIVRTTQSRAFPYMEPQPKPSGRSCYVVIAGGTLNITTGTGATSATSGVTPQGMNRMGGRGWTSTTTTSSDSVSQKGIKAATDLTVLGGAITINSTDDGLHAVNVTVSGGTLSIQTGDDGIHADTSLTISGGTISILQCSEGIESSDITVSGGVTTIVATDDGVNATNGSGSSFNREASDGSLLLVTGGELYVTAGGDALDSNGNLQITGGVVGIYAMSSMGDGAIDYNGTGSLTGGTLIIAFQVHLDGHVATRHRVEGAPHLAEAPRPEALLQAVAPRKNIIAIHCLNLGSIH